MKNFSLMCLEHFLAFFTTLACEVPLELINGDTRVFFVTIFLERSQLGYLFIYYAHNYSRILKIAVRIVLLIPDVAEDAATHTICLLVPSSVL